eukprot:1157789-Pelagomonas_calceolata.AAC.9
MRASSLSRCWSSTALLLFWGWLGARELRETEREVCFEAAFELAALERPELEVERRRREGEGGMRYLSRAVRKKRVWLAT